MLQGKNFNQHQPLFCSNVVCSNAMRLKRLVVITQHLYMKFSWRERLYFWLWNSRNWFSCRTCSFVISCGGFRGVGLGDPFPVYDTETLSTVILFNLLKNSNNNDKLTIGHFKMSPWGAFGDPPNVPFQLMKSKFCKFTFTFWFCHLCQFVGS